MELVTDVLGEGIHLEPKWWLGGEPWIEGMVSAFRPDFYGYIFSFFRSIRYKGK